MERGARSSLLNPQIRMKEIEERAAECLKAARKMYKEAYDMELSESESQQLLQNLISYIAYDDVIPHMGNIEADMANMKAVKAYINKQV